MLQDLNWRILDQRRIDSRLVLLYKVTYDLVAIPASDYLMRNTLPFSRNHLMAHGQITTLKDFYKYTSDKNTMERPTTPHPQPAYLGTVQFGC